MTTANLKSKLLLASYRTQRTFFNDPPVVPPVSPPPPPVVPPVSPPPTPPVQGKVFTQDEVDRLWPITGKHYRVPTKS